MKSQGPAKCIKAIFNGRRYNFSTTNTNLCPTDLDECSESDQHDCDENAECTNVFGSFTCKCKSGYDDRSVREPGEMLLDSPFFF